MWAGQVLSEALNWILKHIIKEERPNGMNLSTLLRWQVADAWR